MPVVGIGGVADGGGSRVGLRGRAVECDLIRAAIDLARQGVCQRLWIQGAPGTGKTAFCDWSVGQAMSFQTVSSSGLEGESELALSALLSVVRGLRAHVEQVSGRYRLALEELLDGTGGGDMFVLGAATLSLLAEAAEQRPVMVVLDDVQWIDPASSVILRFALRRLDADAVVAVLASRLSPLEFGFERSVKVIEIGGLNAAAAAEVLADGGPIAPQVVAGVVAATGGIPLALKEVAAQLSPRQRQGLEPLPEPLPVGDRMLSVYLKRIASLHADTRLGLAVAAAAGSARQSISPALGALNLTGDVLNAAEQTNLVRLGPDGPTFSHPLVRTASLATVSALQRRLIHAALAAVSDAMDERALHLVRSCAGPSIEVADQLEAIALSMGQRREAVAAAGAWLDAGRLTPPGPSRVIRLLRAGAELGSVGRVSEAAGCFDEIVATCADPLLRAEAVTVSTWMRILSPDAITAGLEAAAEADRIEPLSAVHAQRLRIIAATCIVACGQVRTALQVPFPTSPNSGIATAPPTPETTSPPHLLCMDGRLQEATGWLPPERVRLFVGLAVEGVDDLASASAFQLAVIALVWMERLEEALELTEALIARRRRDKRPQDLPILLGVHAEILFQYGRWRETEAALSEAVTLAEDTGQPRMGDLADAYLARLVASRGQPHYQRAAEDMLSRADGTQNKSLELYGLHSLGLGHLGTGRLKESVYTFDRLFEATSLVGLRGPTVVRYRADHIEALIRDGRITRAVQIIDLFDQDVITSGSRWARGVSARAKAMLAGDDTADPLFEVSVDELVDQPFEKARTQLCWGESLRRRRRIPASREQLSAAATIFDGLDARPWAERARRELRATGTRTENPAPTALTELTPQEMQVAMTVAQGQSNRDTASRLFISPKTVEHHLSRVYQKLGLQSRTDLARLFATFPGR